MKPYLLQRDGHSILPGGGDLLRDFEMVELWESYRSVVKEAERLGAEVSGWRLRGPEKLVALTLKTGSKEYLAIAPMGDHMDLFKFIPSEVPAKASKRAVSLITFALPLGLSSKWEFFRTFSCEKGTSEDKALEAMLLKARYALKLKFAEDCFGEYSGLDPKLIPVFKKLGKPKQVFWAMDVVGSMGYSYTVVWTCQVKGGIVALISKFEDNP